MHLKIFVFFTGIRIRIGKNKSGSVKKRIRICNTENLGTCILTNSGIIILTFSAKTVSSWESLVGLSGESCKKRIGCNSMKKYVALELIKSARTEVSS
jgi:hypothetical protein